MLPTHERILISVGHRNSSIGFYDVDDAYPINYGMPNPHEEYLEKYNVFSVTQIKCNGEAQQFATGSEDDTIKIFTMDQDLKVMKKKCKTLTGHSHRVRCLCSNENFLVSGSADETVRVWKDEKCVRVLNDHAYFVFDVRFLGTPTQLATASGDRKIRVYDVEKGKKNHLLREIDEHTHYVNCLKYCDSQHLLFSGSNDGSLKVFDSKSYKRVNSFSHDFYRSVSRIEYLEDCHWVIFGDYGGFHRGNMFCLDLRRPDRFCWIREKAHYKGINRILRYDDKRFITCSYDSFIKIWNIHSVSDGTIGIYHQIKCEGGVFDMCLFSSPEKEGSKPKPLRLHYSDEYFQVFQERKFQQSHHNVQHYKKKRGGYRARGRGRGRRGRGRRRGRGGRGRRGMIERVRKLERKLATREKLITKLKTRTRIEGILKNHDDFEYMDRFNHSNFYHRRGFLDFHHELTGGTFYDREELEISVADDIELEDASESDDDIELEDDHRQTGTNNSDEDHVPVRKEIVKISCKEDVRLSVFLGEIENVFQKINLDEEQNVLTKLGDVLKKVSHFFLEEVVVEPESVDGGDDDGISHSHGDEDGPTQQETEPPQESGTVQLRRKKKTIVTTRLLGDIKIGNYRHRSLLFKIVCDKFRFPCRVIRGWPSFHVMILGRPGIGYLSRLRRRHFLWRRARRERRKAKVQRLTEKFGRLEGSIKGNLEEGEQISGMSLLISRSFQKMEDEKEEEEEDRALSSVCQLVWNLIFVNGKFFVVDVMKGLRLMEFGKMKMRGGGIFEFLDLCDRFGFQGGKWQRKGMELVKMKEEYNISKIHEILYPKKNEQEKVIVVSLVSENDGETIGVKLDDMLKLKKSEEKEEEKKEEVGGIRILENVDINFCTQYLKGVEKMKSEVGKVKIYDFSLSSNEVDTDSHFFCVMKFLRFLSHEHLLSSFFYCYELDKKEAKQSRVCVVQKHMSSDADGIYDKLLDMEKEDSAKSQVLCEVLILFLGVLRAMKYLSKLIDSLEMFLGKDDFLLSNVKVSWNETRHRIEEVRLDLFSHFFGSLGLESQKKEGLDKKKKKSGGMMMHLWRLFSKLVGKYVKFLTSMEELEKLCEFEFELEGKEEEEESEKKMDVIVNVIRRHLMKCNKDDVLKRQILQASFANSNKTYVGKNLYHPQSQKSQEQK